MNAQDASKTKVSCDIFAEFLEVSIHCILYNRGIYPSGVFERRKKYNVPVQMCLHPDVVSYITKVTESVKVMVANGDVSMVTIVVLDPDNTPLERFVFELGKQGELDKNDQYLFQLEDALRAFLLKLNVADSLLKALPEDCSWVVHVHTRESTADKFIQTQTVKDFSWMPADEKQTKLRDASLMPLKTTDNSLLKMQLYVEESSVKPEALF
ncbi:mitotic spindle assembly checkpoint protein MAD2B-like [Mya arenaria]|uniref:mitotic spindle assembly checkpoint protein MAD2B-like n=1 Tax=Mya arenaria TaxID=6604 RepID=UPI0022E03896|nr:mitotic spindle assembly checkpoint protein MAD2B-like [Mya arenaria]